MIANNLHTIPSIEYLPSHLMKDILDRRRNECMTDADLGFFLAATFEAVPAEQLDFLSMRSCRNVTDEGFGFVFRRREYETVVSVQELVYLTKLTSSACSAAAIVCRPSRAMHRPHTDAPAMAPLDTAWLAS